MKEIFRPSSAEVHSDWLVVSTSGVGSFVGVDCAVGERRRGVLVGQKGDSAGPAEDKNGAGTSTAGFGSVDTAFVGYFCRARCYRLATGVRWLCVFFFFFFFCVCVLCVYVCFFTLFSWSSSSVMTTLEDLTELSPFPLSLHALRYVGSLKSSMVSFKIKLHMQRKCRYLCTEIFVLRRSKSESWTSGTPKTYSLVCHVFGVAALFWLAR